MSQNQLEPVISTGTQNPDEARRRQILTAFAAQSILWIEIKNFNYAHYRTFFLGTDVGEVSWGDLLEAASITPDMLGVGSWEELGAVRSNETDRFVAFSRFLKKPLLGYREEADCERYWIFYVHPDGTVKRPADADESHDFSPFCEKTQASLEANQVPTLT